MPALRPVRRLPNMNDRLAADIDRANTAARVCKDAFARRGYELVDTPVLEESDLFLRKSGGELSSRLYEFNEPGGFRTSLRPELTSPVIRHAIETGATESGVRRFQYFGPVFRYAPPEHADGGKTRQFSQLGAEMIGAPSPRSDGEVIAMALEGLRAIGVKRGKIVLGHVGLLWRLLERFPLSERARLFLVSSVGSLRKGDEAAVDVLAAAANLGFLADTEMPVPENLLGAAEVEAVLARSIGPLGANAGSRTASEIVRRLARKQTFSDDPAIFNRAFGMLSDLVTISGPAQSAIDDGRELAANNGLDTECFSLLEEVAGAAIEEGVRADDISVRLGLARGIAYYTGMLFDIVLGEDSDDTLGGGGRYDGLIRALGGSIDRPALGFAYNFDAVLAEADIEPPSVSAAPVLVRADSDDAWAAAAKHAAGLREQGRAAVLDVAAEDSLTFDAGTFAEIIIVSSDGSTRTEEQQ